MENMIDHFAFIRLENRIELVSTSTVLLGDWRTFMVLFTGITIPFLKILSGYSVYTNFTLPKQPIAGKCSHSFCYT